MVNFGKFNFKTSTSQTQQLSQKQYYEKLKSYYDNNDLYETEQAISYRLNNYAETIKPLATSVNRSVNFYVSKLLPGDSIKVTAKNQIVKDCLDQFLTWSNFNTKKNVAFRNLALYGDLFLKIHSTDTKVYCEIIEPKYITDFTEDYRGYLTVLRVDIPKLDENRKPYTYTEYWNKTDGYCCIWSKHQLGDKTDLQQLGTPDTFIYLDELGISFIPVVHIRFKEDTGDEKFGKSCVAHALAKIDEANRQRTRLYQMLYRYNKPLWAVSANNTDKNGATVPTAKIQDELKKLEQQETFVFLPGESKLDSLVPSINYAEALALIQDYTEEIEKDLPELRYYSIKESQLSGRAIKLMLSGAIDRLNEAQSNFITGFTRLCQMALTIGKWLNIFPAGIGSYEDGSFDFSIITSDPFPQDNLEVAQVLQILVSAGMPLAFAMEQVGYSEEEVKKALAAKQEEQVQSDSVLANTLTKFNSE